MVEPKERIARMEQRGVLSAEQAAILRASLSGTAPIPEGRRPKARSSLILWGMTAAAIVLIAILAMLSNLSPEPVVDEVSRTINQPGGYGEMSRSLSAVLAIAVLIVIPLLGWIVLHNSLVGREERVFEAWAQTETTMQRRADLVPALVDTVSRYLEHERGTFTEISAERSAVKDLKAGLDELIRATRASTELMRQRGAEAVEDEQRLRSLAEAEARMGAGIRTVLAVAEDYPELRSSDHFLELQAQLEGTENRINVARVRFNEAVRSYNSAIRYLPGSLIAAIGKFHRKAYFQSAEEAKLAPALAFD